MHTATRTLDDIIDELRLKYDLSVGLLDGKAIREIPSLEVVLNLSKLLLNLRGNLAEAEQFDEELLGKIERKQRKRELDEESVPLAKRRREDASPEKTESEDPVKSEKADSDEEEEDDDDEEAKAGPTHDDRDGKDDPEKAEKTEKAEMDDDNDDEFMDAKETQRGLHDKLESDMAEDSEPVNDGEGVGEGQADKPPEQIGLFTQDNDTRLKNPKSEFVLLQTLLASAIAELGLFSENHNGLETQGKEYLKKKYGVALYPEHDLKNLLPGEIPNIDFSKNKPPANQVQFTTFQLYIELFFRPFLNEDMAFANEKYVLPPGFDKDYDPQLTPYLVPKLGPFYAEAWAKEDAALAQKLSLPAAPRPPLELYQAKGSFEEVDDAKTLLEDVSVGPLLSRLLLAVLSVHEAKAEIRPEIKGEGSEISGEDPEIKDEDDDDQQDPPTQLGSDLNPPDTDYYTMEERLKRELKHIGIFTNMEQDGKPKGNAIVDSDEWLLTKEDDEVCGEMRQLQAELRESVARNRMRKKALIPILEEQLAYQEYCTILDDLDKQVDQAYMKRVRAKNRKRKTPELTISTAQQQAANTGLRALMVKRRRWIDNIGRLFRAPELMKRIPDESVFGNVSDEEEVVQEEE